MRERFNRVSEVTSQAVDALSQVDFTRLKPFLILTILFFAIRLPYVNYGHGTDPDAWRVAMTAYYFLDTGDFFPSRLPGNPGHELLMTVFISGGWIATNLATAMASLVGVGLFARIIKHLAVPNAGLLVVGFAFAPLLVINSISTMDYMWTLTLLLASYYCVITRRPLLAGALLGIAIGCRLHSLILWAPMVYLMWRQERRNEIIPFSLMAGGFALIVFSPVITVYGIHFLNYYDASVPVFEVIRLLGKEALGVIGGLGVLTGIALSLPRFKRLLPDLLQEVHIGVWVAVIGLYFVSFTRLPHEIAYLIPVFPFGLMLLGRYLTRTALAIAVGAIVFAGVFDVTTPGDGISRDTLHTVRIGKGLVRSNAETMRGQRLFVEQIVANPLGERTVVLTGFIFPQLVVRERDRLELRILHRDYHAVAMLSDRGEAIDHERDIRYAWLVTHETFEALRTDGYSFFMVPDAVGATYSLYGYRPAVFGAMFLKLERGPSVAEGQAGTDR
jgi:hypothetical protein